MGRAWVSQPGNLHATYLFAVAGGPEIAAQVSFVAALAVYDLVTALLPDVKPLIKWPNDVLIGGAKFCGLLAEVAAHNPTMIALGCGINVAHAPEATPYPVTALARHGVIPDLALVLRELDARLTGRLTVWDEGRGFAAIRKDWMAQAAGLNEAAVAVLGEKEIHGVVRGLAGDGALILELADGNRQHIHAGEVRFAAIEALRKNSR